MSERQSTLIVNPKMLLFKSVVFMAAFSGVRGLLPLGEVSYEGYAIPMLMFIGVSMASQHMITNKLLFRVILGFVFLVVITTILNGGDILSNHFKARSGLSKLIGQLVMFVIFAMYAVSLYSLFRKQEGNKMLETIKRYSIYSFYVVMPYCFFEFLANYIGLADSLVDTIDAIIRDEKYAYYSFRLRGFQYESPAFGSYLGYMCIVFLDEIISKKKKSYVLFLPIIFLLVFGSGSRTGLIVCVFNCGAFLFLASRAGRINITKIIVVGLIGMILVLTTTNMKSVLLSMFEVKVEGNYHAASNFARFGSQVGAVSIGLDNPYTGIGYGQFGFVIPQYYPDWLDNNFIIAKYKSPLYPNWPLGYSFLFRLFAEFGPLIFSFLLIVVVKVAWGMYRNIVRKKSYETIFVLVLFGHSLLVFLQFDSLRVIHFWHFLVLYALIWTNTKKLSPTS